MSMHVATAVWPNEKPRLEAGDIVRIGKSEAVGHIANFDEGFYTVRVCGEPGSLWREENSTQRFTPGCLTVPKKCPYTGKCLTKPKSNTVLQFKLGDPKTVTGIAKGHSVKVIDVAADEIGIPHRSITEYPSAKGRLV